MSSPQDAPARRRQKAKRTKKLAAWRAKQAAKPAGKKKAAPKPAAAKPAAAKPAAP